MAIGRLDDAMIAMALAASGSEGVAAVSMRRAGREERGLPGSEGAGPESKSSAGSPATRMRPKPPMRSLHRPDRPFGEAFPALAEAMRKCRRPRSDNPKVAVSLRLEQEVVHRFKAGGPGWRIRMNRALREAAGLSGQALQGNAAQGGAGGPDRPPDARLRQDVSRCARPEQTCAASGPCRGSRREPALTGRRLPSRRRIAVRCHPFRVRQERRRVRGLLRFRPRGCRRGAARVSCRLPGAVSRLAAAGRARSRFPRGISLSPCECPAQLRLPLARCLLAFTCRNTGTWKNYLPPTRFGWAI